VTVRYRFRADHGLRRITKTTRLIDGAFKARLRLPAAARRARRGSVSVSYPGDGTFAAEQASRRVRFPRSA
jgi:hypothetical protein